MLDKENDEDWEVNICKEELSEYDQKYLTYDDRGYWRPYCTTVLLTEPCNRDIIPAGDYLISISW